MSTAIESGARRSTAPAVRSQTPREPYAEQGRQQFRRDGPV